MDFCFDYNQNIAAAIARLFLGFLFFFQGYDAIFKIKLTNVINAYHESFISLGIPKLITAASAWFTSYTELICGGMLIFGVLQHIALLLLGLNLIVAAIGFGITNPLWDTKYVLPRLILILFLLSIPREWDIFSIDYLINKQ